MKKSRFTEEQSHRFLKQAEAGMQIKELCRSGGFSDATFYKWRAKFGGMQVSEAQHFDHFHPIAARIGGNPLWVGEAGFTKCMGER